MQDRTEEHDLIRAIAIALRDIKEFGRSIPDELTARARLFQVLVQRCDLGEATLEGDLVTTAEESRSLKALTFKHTKLPLRLWLAGIWHLHVDEQSIAARVFGRRYGIDKMSAWRLLRRVRDAFITFSPSDGAVRSQSLGRQSATNEAWCHTAVDDGRMCVTNEDVPRARKANSAGALVSGYFRRWLVTQFRGIAAANLELYGAEFADRFRRRAMFTVPAYLPLGEATEGPDG